MMETPSYSYKGSSWRTAVVALSVLAALPGTTRAQSDDLSAACADASSAVAGECYIAAAAVRTIHPRVGTALWGGSPVPGTASTLGMRFGSFPRMSFSGRLVVLPMELPPLPNRVGSAPPMPTIPNNESQRAITVGLSGQSTVGLLSGWSPMPTVGGVLAVDGIGRASWLHLPGGQGFQQNGVLGGSLGLRVGLLRESFTLPGVSVTGSYGRSTTVGYGDAGSPGGGHIESAIGNWNVTGAITKRVGPLGLTGGAAMDRYTGDVEFSYVGGPLEPERADAATDRWSVFANLSLSLLIFHAALEGGWQESPVPEGLPADVTVEPTGWWTGLALRMSL